MHHHGYLWTGPKRRFDEEALRRPPHPEPPSVGSRPELIQRYREVVAEFRVVDLPPIETANWLLKPRTLVRGTWDDPEEAAAWLGERLREYAPRFTVEAERDVSRLARLVESAVERLAWGGDVSLGFYLEHPSYVSLAVVTCSYERAEPACPLR
ncbi:hypothetical protein SAMN04487983_102131 [Streptomyces sp. yr375]|uniref:hypothetical protein n=1 Tax=Streptomyces sp. yr375 TaxID=1761906 RepID=UPI0008AD2DA1|nr:hypothetical protein [Streptomyces sp. yr375]SER73138.1 hypothetical protein SAMN04487983_102131 [Streptomyces sp. yr375]